MRHAVLAYWTQPPTTAHPAGSKFIPFNGTRSACDRFVQGIERLREGTLANEDDMAILGTVYIFDPAKNVLLGKIVDGDYRNPDPARTPVALPEPYDPGTGG